VVVVVGGTVVVVGGIVVVVGGAVVVVVGGDVVVVGGEVVVVGGEVVAVVVVVSDAFFEEALTCPVVVVVLGVLELVLVDGTEELVLVKAGAVVVDSPCELLPVATIGNFAAPGECSSVATITPPKSTTTAASPTRSRQLAGGAEAKTNSV